MGMIVSLSVLLIASFASEAKGWRGIIPLRSNRADVERLLGQPTGSCKCIYDTGSEIGSIFYSGEPCADNIPYTYNVPRDTELEITVRPKQEMTVADLQIDRRDFRKAGDSERSFIVYYNNHVEGVIVEAAACQDRVIKIIYKPTRDNSVPACTKGNGIFDPAKPQLVDIYRGIRFSAQKQHLNLLANVLRQMEWMNGYLVYYVGQREQANRAEMEIGRAKEYLVKERGIDAMRVVTILGGYRDAPSAEVYLWPDMWREYFGEVGDGNCAPGKQGRR